MMTPRRTDRHEHTLAVENGQVVCPRRGVVDIERCWACPAYRGLSTGPIEMVVCGATFGPAWADLQRRDPGRLPSA